MPIANLLDSWWTSQIIKGKNTCIVIKIGNDKWSMINQLTSDVLYKVDKIGIVDFKQVRSNNINMWIPPAK